MGLNEERVLPGTSRAAQADACDMCCSAPVISYFCPRLCQPASIPATSQPASTSLLLGQRLSKGIILLFPTPLFLHPSVILFPSLAQVRPSLARPSRHRWLQESGRLSGALTPTPQDKFIHLLQLRASCSTNHNCVCSLGRHLSHMWRKLTRLRYTHLQSSSWHLKVGGSYRDGGHRHRPCIITQRAPGSLSNNNNNHKLQSALGEKKQANMSFWIIISPSQLEMKRNKLPVCSVLRASRLRLQ